MATNTKRQVVKYHQARNAMDRLPFMGKRKRSAKRRVWSDRTAWAERECSGYGTGCRYGAAAALALMKHYREHPEKSIVALQHIVIDMTGTGKRRTSRGDWKRGQIVGFFNLLDQMLRERALMSNRLPDDRYGGTLNLDTLTEEEIEKRMTDAANMTDAELEAEWGAIVGLWDKAA